MPSRGLEPLTFKCSFHLSYEGIVAMLLFVMKEMHYVERYQCDPDTAEPYLLKLCVIPTTDDVSVGEGTYHNIN